MFSKEYYKNSVADCIQVINLKNELIDMHKDEKSKLEDKLKYAEDRIKLLSEQVGMYRNLLVASKRIIDGEQNA